MSLNEKNMWKICYLYYSYKNNTNLPYVISFDFLKWETLKMVHEQITYIQLGCYLKKIIENLVGMWQYEKGKISGK